MQIVYAILFTCVLVENVPVQSTEKAIYSKADVPSIVSRTTVER